jgi:hypothetical protein
VEPEDPVTELSVNDDERRAGRAPGGLRVVAGAEAASTAGGGEGWRPYLVPLVLLLAGPVVLALVVLDAPAWIRAVPVLAYVATAPGIAVIRLLRLRDRPMVVLLGIGFSLALGAIVAQLMIYASVWSPTLGISALAAVASLAAAVDAVRTGGSR